jgi:NADPH:quinone reductase-like Zn-dependent oxidoreductase
MQAITQRCYGAPDVLELRDVDTPLVNDNDVLVRVRAASANPYDWHFMRGVPYVFRLIVFGFPNPKHTVLGSDLAGQVERVGSNVTRFHPGDEVFGNVRLGGFAEYASVSEDVLGLKPANLTFEQAAAVPLAAMTALQGLRDAGGIQPEQKVLIVGASGGVGTFAVQIAKSFGADVTGVCSTRNTQMVRSIGADHVVDYTQEDFTRGGRTYDLIFQLAGTRSAPDCMRALTSNGTLVLSSGDSGGRWIGPLDRIIAGVVSSLFVSQRLRVLDTKRSLPDLRYLTALIEAGKLTPVIDRTYPLRKTPEAIRYLETGRAQGKVIITV